MTEKQYRITSTLPVTDRLNAPVYDIIAQATEGGPEVPEGEVTRFHRKDRRACEFMWGPRGAEQLGRILLMYENPGGELRCRVVFNVGRRIKYHEDALLAGKPPMTLSLTYNHSRHQGTGAEIWRFPALRLYPTPVQAEGED